MLNGKQKGDANIEVLKQWIASKTDEDFRQIEFKGKLKRKEIAVECGFALSVLNQNPSVRDVLNALESDLRQRGILPQRAENAEQALGMSSISEKRHRAEQERIRRLETENAALKAENAELKERLLDFGALTDVLTATGRLPR